MRAGDDAAPGRLAEHLGQSHHRDRARGDDVGQNLAGTDGGQLVDVAHDQQGRPVRNGVEQGLHQQDIDHRAFVDHQEIAVERALEGPLEGEGLRVELEEAVNGPGLHSGRLGHAPGRTAGRGAEQELHGLGLQDAQDGVDDGRLAHAGAARDDQHLGSERQADGLGLALREGEPGPALDPKQSPVRIDPGPGHLPRRDARQPVRDRLLRTVKTAEEDAGGACDAVGDQGALPEFEVHRRPDQIHRHLEQLHREGGQVGHPQPAMAVSHCFAQGIGDARPHPDHRGLLDPELPGDQVGRAEPDAADVTRKPVGVLAHHLHRVGAVGLEDANGPCRADAMLVEKHHDLPDDLLVSPGRGYPPGALGTDPFDLPQPLRRGLDDVEDVLAEMLHHAPCVDRADAPHHSRAEILLDALER